MEEESCTVLERQEKWPYVRACRAPALARIDFDWRIEQQIDATTLCGVHLDLLMKGFPNAKVERFDVEPESLPSD